MESQQFESYWAKWSMLAVRDGVLFRKWESEIIWKLVLPGRLRAQVLRQLHDSPVAGHLGCKKTIERVKARFYWCGLRKDVESWCDSTGPWKPCSPNLSMITKGTGTCT